MESVNRKLLRHLDKQYGPKVQLDDKSAKEIKTSHYQDHLNFVETDLNTASGEGHMSFRSPLSEEEEQEYLFKKESSKPMTIKRTSIMEISSNDITEIENAAFKGQEL